MLKLPVPEPEFQFMKPERLFKFDFAWIGVKVAWEYEGGTWTGGGHVRGKVYRDNCVKYNEASLRGWVVIRATADMVKDGSAWTFLERALASRSQSS